MTIQECAGSIAFTFFVFLIVSLFHKKSTEDIRSSFNNILKDQSELPSDTQALQNAHLLCALFTALPQLFFTGIVLNRIFFQKSIWQNFELRYSVVGLLFFAFFASILGVLFIWNTSHEIQSKTEIVTVEKIPFVLVSILLIPLVAVSATILFCTRSQLTPVHILSQLFVSFIPLAMVFFTYRLPPLILTDDPIENGKAQLVIQKTLRLQILFFTLGVYYLEYRNLIDAFTVSARQLHTPDTLWFIHIMSVFFVYVGASAFSKNVRISYDIPNKTNKMTKM